MARARAGGIYSRFVSWMKVVLPLVALGLLSTIFLFARPSDPTQNLPIATQRSLADRSSEMVTQPSYAGATPSGALLTLKAAQARPDAREGSARAEALTAAMTWPDGSRVDLSAPGGTITDDTNEARLTGGVSIRSSTGYRMTTEALTASLDRVNVESDGTVTAEGPAGDLTAGRMLIQEARDDNGDVRLLFTDGVRVIYRP
jgi:lipopolysaccharide export system protein LptC